MIRDFFTDSVNILTLHDIIKTIILYDYKDKKERKSKRDKM